MIHGHQLFVAFDAVGCLRLHAHEQSASRHRSFLSDVPDVHNPHRVPARVLNLDERHGFYSAVAADSAALRQLQPLPGAHGAGQGREAPSLAREALTRAIAPAQSAVGASTASVRAAIMIPENTRGTET